MPTTRSSSRLTAAGDQQEAPEKAAASSKPSRAVPAKRKRKDQPATTDKSVRPVAKKRRSKKDPQDTYEIPESDYNVGADQPGNVAQDTPEEQPPAGQEKEPDAPRSRLRNTAARAAQSQKRPPQEEANESNTPITSKRPRSSKAPAGKKPVEPSRSRQASPELGEEPRPARQRARPEGNANSAEFAAPSETSVGPDPEDDAEDSSYGEAEVITSGSESGEGEAEKDASGNEDDEVVETASSTAQGLTPTYPVSIVEFNEVLKAIGSNEWTKEGAGWIKKLSLKLAENEDGWVKRHKQKCTAKKSVVGLLRRIFNFWELLEQAPNSSLDKQERFLQLQKTSRSNFARDLEGFVETTRDELKRLHDGIQAKNIHSGLHLRIVPLLLMTVQRSFELPMNHRSSKQEIRLAKTGVEDSYLIMRSTLSLCRGMLGYVKEKTSHENDDDDEMQEYLDQKISYKTVLNQLEALYKKIETALRTAEDEEKARKRKANEDNGTYGMRGHNRERTLERRTEVRYAYRTQPPVRPRAIEVVTSRPSQRPFQRATPTTAEEKKQYYKNNGGWNYDEDDRLLTMLRRTSPPDYKAISEEIMSRTAEQLQQRASKLKANAMSYFEETLGVPPPQWCYP